MVTSGQKKIIGKTMAAISNKDPNPHPQFKREGTSKHNKWSPIIVTCFIYFSMNSNICINWFACHLIYNVWWIRLPISENTLCIPSSEYYSPLVCILAPFPSIFNPNTKTILYTKWTFLFTSNSSFSYRANKIVIFKAK